MKQHSYIVSVFSTMFSCLFSVPLYAQQQKNYHYSIELGYPSKYPIILSRVELPTTGKANDSLYVSKTMARPGPWGSGSQASSIISSQPLPTYIKMQWFSVSENQFWEIDAPIDQGFFKNTIKYSTINPFTYFKNRQTLQPFMERTTWNIYAVPGGKAFIWISGARYTYESYLIATLQAKKIDLDWNVFAFRNDIVNNNKSIPNRADFVKDQLQKAAKETHSSVTNLTNKNADQWLGYLKKYNWVMKVEPPFELKDVEARYTNNEAHVLYADTDQTKILPRAIPKMLEFFIVDKKTNYLSRVRVTFGKDYYENFEDDWQEIINAFETLDHKSPINGLITLDIKIAPDLKKLDLFLIKGNSKIELKNVKASLIDTYDDYSPIVCDNYSPQLQMNESDFTNIEKGSKIFKITDQSHHPVPYYKYKLLREDGKFYYGVTGLDGQTTRVKTFVNGKWLNLDLYDDNRENCVSKEEIPKDLHVYKPTPKLPTNGLFFLVKKYFLYNVHHRRIKL